MVEQITAAVSDPTLGNAVLPRASETGSLGLDAEALYRLLHFIIEVCTTVKDKIARRGVIRKCLAQLLNNPGARRMSSHVEMQDATPVMCNNEKAVENAEGEASARRRSPSQQSPRDDYSEKRTMASPVRDFEELFASSATRCARRCRSRAFATHHECAARPGAIFGDHAQDELTQATQRNPKKSFATRESWLRTASC